MPKALSVIIEHLHEKRGIFVIFGLLMGLMSILIMMLVDTLDLASLAAIMEFLPEELLEFFGGIATLTTPYGFVNAELFTFVWLFVGIFLVYIASGTALPGEVEDKTIDLILSKPISRASYLMSKVTFLYLFIIGLISVVFAFIGIGMATSQTFIDFGLHWDRLLAVYMINIVHLGTLVMTALLFATITLSSKKTMGAALAIMFLMYFIGLFWGFFPEEQQIIKYLSTWFYLGTEDLFVHGIFDNFLRDILVLSGINVVLVVSSLLVFRRKDIPV
jgi:ABC-2 type transport system permease protein